MKFVEVKTQAEFDAEVKLGNAVIVRDGFFIARDNSTVTARGDSNVTAFGNSNVKAFENSTVIDGRRSA